MVSEEIWGGITNTKGHLKGHIKTYYKQKLLKIYINERNINRATYSWGMGENAPGGQLLPPSNNSSVGCHLIELLVKAVPCKPQTTQAIAQAVGCSS